MENERTIRVFLASSEELENDRNAFGNLIRRLNDIYRKRGIRIELFEWEDYDAAYNDRRKQDEYNDYVRASDMFLAVFHRKAGKFTIEEFDVASEEFRRTGTKPKTYVYCRDLQEGEEESAELRDFKRRLFDEMGHYWSRYNNRDSMQLHFVMQLQLVESGRADLKVENGAVTLDGAPVARMEKLRFAADNPDYQRMSQRLQELPEKIEKARLRVEKYPDEEDFRDDLQRLLDERNALQEEFDRQQHLLFDTALRIAQLQSDTVTDRMRRAIEAFERGDVRQANIILDEAERDADRNLQDFRQARDLAEQKRKAVIASIDELLLKCSTLMADSSIPIADRIEQTHALYRKADQLAAEVDYEKEKYGELLSRYADFLRDYALYTEALHISQRYVVISEELYGTAHPDTATSYNNIGAVYDSLGDYDKALEYYGKALAIREKVLGTEHPNTADSYNNIGLVYNNMGDYDKALEYYGKALAIDEKMLGTEHPDTATSYNNIGGVYDRLGDYDQALEYYNKALVIWKMVLGSEHPDTATSYDNIGGVYYNQGDYDKALEYYGKALTIKEKVLGTEHPSTATSYNNIGLVYDDMGDYDQALEYYGKALAIHEKVLGTAHPDTATTYNNIGVVYNNMGDYDQALEYYGKALAIEEKMLGTEHPSTATSYNNIGLVYDDMGDYDQALEYYSKALAIQENVLGTEHPNTATSYNNIGGVYDSLGDYDKALEYYGKALNIFIKTLGSDHPNVKIVRQHIADVKAKMGDN